MNAQGVVFVFGFVSLVYFTRELWRHANSPEVRREFQELEYQRRMRQIEREIAEYKRRHGASR